MPTAHTALFFLPFALTALVLFARVGWLYLIAEDVLCHVANARIEAESFLPVQAKQPTGIKVWSFDGRLLNTLTIRPL